MRRGLIIAATVAMATPAAGQTVVTPPRYAAAPWWMGKQVIPALGQAKIELRANRASTRVGFRSTADTPAQATQAVIDRVKNLNAQLAAFGPDRVRTALTFQVEPIYQQYRGKGGALVDNRRPDKISSYRVTGDLVIEVHDLAVLEQVYGDVISALPDAVEAVSFSLEPENDVTAGLRLQATQDAAHRAKLSADAVGDKLGPVKVIDPSGAACRAAPLLASAPPAPQPAANAGGQGSKASLVLVDGQRVVTSGQTLTNISQIPMSALGAIEIIPDGASAIYGTDAIAGVINLAMRAPPPINIQMPLQPPMIAIEETACVVYSLG